MGSDSRTSTRERDGVPRYTIEIDTGGTFTDGYVAGGDQVITAKADTTPYDLATGVLACVDRAAERLGMSRAQLLRLTEAFRLSTTVGTNTLINRSGPAVGLLLGEDVMPAADRLSSDLPLDRELVATVPEGDADAVSIQTAVRGLLERGARVLVIALSGGQHLETRENTVRALIAERYPRHYLGAVPVLPSHQVTPLDDERLRVQTAVLSAYLHPVMSQFLYRVEDALRADGYTLPLLVANASGGTSRVAKTAALRTWGSGPAGGVAGTAALSAELEIPVAVGFDVGGTSTDVCVIVAGQWQYEVQPSIEEIEVALPAISLVSAPVGGGTIARIVDGELTLGPDSAGAQPGPACFGLGGDQVTVTDAVCHLGLFDPDSFLGGRKRLDAAAARVALEGLAGPAGWTVEHLATQILTRAGEVIADTITAQLEAAGITEPVSLFATGGAGGMLAGFVDAAARPRETFAFPVSPVFSAFGLSRLDVAHAYEASSSSPTLEADLEALQERAFADMRAEGFTPEDVHFAEETEIVDASGTARVVAGRVESDQRDGRPRMVRLTAYTRGRRARFPRAGTRQPESTSSRLVQWPQGSQTTPVFEWEALAAGATIHGPAILETDETTLAVPPKYSVHVGSMGEARLMAP
ncbi:MULTISPECIES: hydantoinase/oxoprolinase family protein [Prauserella salsuginis group]|uniref:Hydantoinase/oxoprolinase family protein n=1 Tax=Prauserella salsuginis TaxID=387889 RepID=A0ABW6G0S0_9PSEU|nr:MULTISPECIES: hydantoinase/oxoprolinase family protein [Prauserella salsuginis group]MCR3721946.1 acetophenone carboxylase [Prauserella flava]MCR3735952.1 acetophenone carboxylase [Prauserella salsuginis]